MRKISIIVPMYNASKTINECLDSIIAQTIFMDIEIIIVDDCSEDDSTDRAVKYEEKYPDHIMLIKLTENAGPGNARNIGLSYASGEYIAYVDSDDAITGEACELLYNEAVRTGADIVDSGFYDQRDGIAYLYAGDDIVGKLDDNKRSAMIVSGGYVFAKLFKRSFLLDRDILFRKEYVLEDMDFLIEALAMADHLAAVKKTTYVYRNSEGSLSKSVELGKYIHSMSSAMAAIHDKTSSLQNYEGIREAVEYAMIHLYSNMINQCINEVYYGRLRSDEIVGLLESLRKIRTVCISDGYNNRYVHNKIDEKSISVMKENDRSPEGLAEQLKQSFEIRRKD